MTCIWSGRPRGALATPATARRFTLRRAVIAGRMLRVTGRLQRAHSVTHVLAEQIEDLSPMLDRLVRPED